MMRTRQRKTIEELYGNKFDAAKSQVTGQQQLANNMTKSVRDYGYIITTNSPYTGTLAPPNSTSMGTTKNLNTSRDKRKSARPSNKLATEKLMKPEKDPYASEDLKHEHNMKMKGGSRSEKPPSYYSSPPIAAAAAPPPPNCYDNKTYAPNYKDMPLEGSAQHQYHHHHKHNHRHDEDKDDDTDEFFQLIRHTVENAIGKSISELLNRNFRELFTKFDRFSAELNNTNALLNQIQIDMNNKIVHYGEENSRHFRYLCMKSEYDKMFYQHQTMVASTVVTTPTTAATGLTTTNSNTNTEVHKPEKHRSNPKLNINNAKTQRNNDGGKTKRSGNAKTAPTTELAKETRKKSSEDVSQKSSDVGMREVLEHIQKFCNQMQMNDMNSNGLQAAASPKAFHAEEFLKINKEIFNDDDDDDEVEDEVDDEVDDMELSSDGMTPRCDGSETHRYGGSTKRGCMTSRVSNGGGDA